jgi:putative transposase
MVIPPKYAVSFVIETIKKNTARALKEKFPFIKTLYINKPGIWSTGYFVATVGINEHIIRRYVTMQGNEDTGQAQLEF